MMFPSVLHHLKGTTTTFSAFMVSPVSSHICPQSWVLCLTTQTVCSNCPATRMHDPCTKTVLILAACYISILRLAYKSSNLVVAWIFLQKPFSGILLFQVIWIVNIYHDLIGKLLTKRPIRCIPLFQYYKIICTPRPVQICVFRVSQSMSSHFVGLWDGCLSIIA